MSSDRETAGDLLVVRESGPGTLKVVERGLDSDRAADVAERVRREHPGRDVEVLSPGALELMALSSGYDLDT